MKSLHKDVLDRILNILKQDDYYRTLEELPVIDEHMMTLSSSQSYMTQVWL